ncbi:MAG: exodeoxyribonuclease VII large subunit [Christensenella sp.]|uniref:exodeoxyribonuclease VII large subunit n=1 Tax=Christensenella sp. TaxID=1935934 RepID=UPI002B1F4DA1|nr:exodeoxyribonuclease VII large subunit [Christensenella sp.]MEA5004591.1 exodeoxyribonuclease VII large subunit [Christensenella sp.]
MDELVLSVGELNTYVADKLSGDPFLEEIWVKGEVTDVNMRASTIYFVLRDEQAAIDCMLFDCEDAQRYAEILAEGQTVLTRGDVSIYRKNGKYRLIVRELQIAGMGELYMRFLQLKEKLQRKGVFDEGRKRPIPKYPKKIGIVTSERGAVIQDIKNIAQRRNPAVKLMLYPVKVQGSDAPQEIVRGMEYFNENTDVDVLIVGRGGGSAEDLMAFNDEEVVMAVYRSRIPVVSAVGHETDYSLCDMAADMRAPTPSAAAELTIPLGDEIAGNLALIRENIERRFWELLDKKEEQISDYTRRLNREVLVARVSGMQEKLQNYDMQSKTGIKHLYHRLVLQYNNYKNAIDNLSPLSAFERGYSVAMRGENEIRSIGDVSVGDEIRVLLKDGSILAAVKDKEVQ